MSITQVSIPTTGGGESEVTMSDIVIRNTKMPQTCAACPLKQKADWNLYTCPFLPNYAFSLINKHRSADCPMEELGPHGPLVDISKAQVVLEASREVE